MYYALNGHFLKLHEAHLHPEDRGFRFGDGVFETIRIHNGKPYLWKEHLNRLFAGLEALRITCDVLPLRAQLEELIQRNGHHQGIARISISRGVGSRGYLPTGDSPTVLIETHALPNVPAGHDNALCLSPYTRVPPSCMPTQFKLMQGTPSVLSKMFAHERGCVDSVQLSVNGHVAECSSSTLLWMRGKTLYVPSLDTGRLDGVTAARLLRHIPYRIKVGHFKLKHLLKADAVIITNSGMLATPIHRFMDGDKMVARFSASDTLYERCRIFFEQDMETNTGLDEEEAD